MAGLKRVTEALKYQANMERLVQYAERRFAKGHDWPTVREAARALKMKQADIIQLAEDSSELCLDSYNVYPPQPMAEHFVYSMRS